MAHMDLSEERLRTLLAPRMVRFFQQTPSTQDNARQWLHNDAPSGAVVIADEQIAGRGRLGRTWITPPDSALALSIILRPTPDHLSQITLLGAVAVATTVETFGVQPGIKWPNDVRLNGLKFCGILPEAVWDGSTLCGVILGIGVNVRVDFSATEVTTTATSLEPALGRSIDRATLAHMILGQIDYWWPHLGTLALFQAWQARLDMLGQLVTVQTANDLIQGHAEAVNAQGALLVRQDDGTIQTVLAGDVRSSG
jgi:BirA family transcriptional regulator, biotin operon repressor / biotin---[acetyl-CoA-carboxylase] ligase